MNKNGIIRAILTGLTIFSILIIIISMPVTRRKNKELDVLTFKENTVKPKMELYDLKTMLLFDDYIYCLNDSKNYVMILSKDGILKKTLYIPGIYEHGINCMYLYRDKLYILDKQGTLYRYSSFDKYEKIILKNENEVQIFNNSGEMVDSVKLKENYDEILAYEDQKCYLNVQGNDEVIICNKSGNIEKKKFDYEEFTNVQGNKKCIENNTQYSIGKMRNKILKEENGEKVVLQKSSIRQLLFMSDLMRIIMISLVVFIAFIRRYTG